MLRLTNESHQGLLYDTVPEPENEFLKLVGFPHPARPVLPPPCSLGFVFGLYPAQ